MSKPYFENASVTLYHANCLDLLPRLAADSVDLLLTDPPYGVSYESNWRKDGFGLIAGDATQDVAMAALKACQRVLRNSTHAYVFGPFDLSPLLFTPAVELIWDKEYVGGGDLTLPWGKSHEPIQFCVYKKSRCECETRGTLSARIRKGSVIRIDNRSERMGTRHPTEKPVLLLRQLIESSSCFGDLILDPFAGVGSTGVAAQLEGRRALLIELEERYCEIAARRLSQAVLPFEMEAQEVLV